MIKITEIREHSKGLWLVHYELWASCMCSFTAHSIVIGKKTEPTEKQILEAINKGTDETNDK